MKSSVLSLQCIASNHLIFPMKNGTCRCLFEVPDDCLKAVFVASLEEQLLPSCHHQKHDDPRDTTKLKLKLTISIRSKYHLTQVCCYVDVASNLKFHNQLKRCTFTPNRCNWNWWSQFTLNHDGKSTTTSHQWRNPSCLHDPGRSRNFQGLNVGGLAVSLGKVIRRLALWHRIIMLN